MKSAKDKKNFLEHLRKLPNISSACEATNTSRQTIYRWKADDKKFASNLEEALSEGNDYMCDFVESQLISKIRDNHFPAIKYHLNKRHPKYMEKKEKEKEEIIKEEFVPDAEYFSVPDNIDELLASDKIIPAKY